MNATMVTDQAETSNRKSTAEQPLGVARSFLARLQEDIAAENDADYWRAKFGLLPTKNTPSVASDLAIEITESRQEEFVSSPSHHTPAEKLEPRSEAPVAYENTDSVGVARQPSFSSFFLGEGDRVFFTGDDDNHDDGSDVSSYSIPSARSEISMALKNASKKPAPSMIQSHMEFHEESTADSNDQSSKEKEVNIEPNQSHKTYHDNGPSTFVGSADSSSAIGKGASFAQNLKKLGSLKSFVKKVRKISSKKPRKVNGMPHMENEDRTDTAGYGLKGEGKNENEEVVVQEEEEEEEKEEEKATADFVEAPSVTESYPPTSFVEPERKTSTKSTTDQMLSLHSDDSREIDEYKKKLESRFALLETLIGRSNDHDNVSDEEERSADNSKVISKANPYQKSAAMGAIQVPFKATNEFKLEIALAAKRAEEERLAKMEIEKAEAQSQREHAQFVALKEKKRRAVQEKAEAQRKKEEVELAAIPGKERFAPEVIEAQNKAEGELVARKKKIEPATQDEAEPHRQKEKVSLSVEEEQQAMLQHQEDEAMLSTPREKGEHEASIESKRQRIQAEVATKKEEEKTGLGKATLQLQIATRKEKLEKEAVLRKVESARKKREAEDADKIEENKRLAAEIEVIAEKKKIARLAAIEKAEMKRKKKQKAQERQAKEARREARAAEKGRKKKKQQLLGKVRAKLEAKKIKKQKKMEGISAVMEEEGTQINESVKQPALSNEVLEESIPDMQNEQTKKKVLSSILRGPEKSVEESCQHAAPLTDIPASTVTTNPRKPPKKTISWSASAMHTSPSPEPEPRNVQSVIWWSTNKDAVEVLHDFEGKRDDEQSADSNDESSFGNSTNLSESAMSELEPTFSFSNFKTFTGEMLEEAVLIGEEMGAVGKKILIPPSVPGLWSFTSWFSNDSESPEGMLVSKKKKMMGKRSRRNGK